MSPGGPAEHDIKGSIWHRRLAVFFVFLFLSFNSTGVSCLQALNSISSHAKVPDTESSRTGKDGLPPAKQQRALTDAHSNIFVLRKMVEEVFSVLYSKNLTCKKKTSSGYIAYSAVTVSRERLYLHISRLLF